MTDLGTLGGATSRAIRINTAGQVVGFADIAEDEDTPFHAFLWENGEMIDLGTLGGQDSRANGVNDAGQIVGRARNADGGWRAFLWEDGIMRDLGTPPDFTAGVAVRINASEQVVGWAETENGFEGPVHAVLWANGTATDLGTLGGNQSLAFGLDDAGRVVGRSLDARGGERAFLWQDGEMMDLGSLVDPALGWVLNAAYAINNQGQIAGVGTLNGEARAFLLTLPVALAGGE